MAVFEEKKQHRLGLDDTVPLTCSIISSKNLKDHTEYEIRVQRGPVPENCWTVTKRYSDFVNLDTALRISAIELPLPPKKVFGNMDREFIAERQSGLQNFLQVLLSHPYLANSIIVKRFLDLHNYEANLQEVALQNISMFFRSEPKWEVVEPMPDIGTRIRKQYFLIKDKAQPKEKFVLSWCNFGPDKFLQDKDLVNIMKLFSTFQHPHLYPISFAMANEAGGIAIRKFQTQGTLRDILCKAKPRTHLLKKYSNPKMTSCCQTPAIGVIGRQILETLKFLHDKGISYGHLHAGNIIVEENKVQFLDLENSLLGLPSYYRCYYTQLKKVNTVEEIDVYSFGHLLYEIATGHPLTSATCDNYPAIFTSDLRSVLELILSTEAGKNGLPTVADLLQNQFFKDVALPASEKPQVKIPSKLKEALRESKLAVEKRLKEEKKVIKQFKRLSKAQAFHMSEEEKKKRRRSKKKLLSEDGSTTSNGLVPATTTSPTPASSSVPVAPSPPPAVPPVNAPPPPPPPVNTTRPLEGIGGEGSSSRGALLSSITGFNKTGLKKAQTLDKSGPRV